MHYNGETRLRGSTPGQGLAEGLWVGRQWRQCVGGCGGIIV